MQMQKRELPEGWDKDFPVYEADAKGIASRESSGKMLELIGKNVPWMIGGAADLVKSTKTILKGQGTLSPTEMGRNINYGIREHAMGAIANGLALSKMRTFDSTFLIFSDYMRNPIRLSALMEIPVIHIFTHDSIGVGEDGPTHQPVEQIASLRAIPGMLVIRPADANEVVEAWRVIMVQKQHPVCLILSRQNLPTIDRTKFAPASGIAKGAYVLADAKPGEKPEVILIGTGSEVDLCIKTYEKLKEKGVNAAWSACRHGNCSNTRNRATATRCCRTMCAPASYASRLPTWDGSAGPGLMAPRSRCIPLALPRRSRTFWRSSVSLKKR